jgi:hypothetical protein
MTCPVCGSVSPDDVAVCSRCALSINSQPDETPGLEPANYRAAVQIVWRNTVSHLAGLLFGAALILAVADWQRWIAIALFGIECAYAAVNLIQVAIITLATAYLGPLKLISGLKNRELFKDEIYDDRWNVTSDSRGYNLVCDSHIAPRQVISPAGKAD